MKWYEAMDQVLLRIFIGCNHFSLHFSWSFILFFGISALQNILVEFKSVLSSNSMYTVGFIALLSAFHRQMALIMFENMFNILGKQPFSNWLVSVLLYGFFILLNVYKLVPWINCYSTVRYQQNVSFDLLGKGKYSNVKRSWFQDAWIW